MCVHVICIPPSPPQFQVWLWQPHMACSGRLSVVGYHGDQCVPDMLELLQMAAGNTSPQQTSS